MKEQGISSKDYSRAHSGLRIEKQFGFWRQRLFPPCNLRIHGEIAKHASSSKKQRASRGKSGRGRLSVFIKCSGFLCQTTVTTQCRRGASPRASGRDTLTARTPLSNRDHTMHLRFLIEDLRSARGRAASITPTVLFSGSLFQNRVFPSSVRQEAILSIGSNESLSQL